jgi:hypothetical protein
MMDEYEDEDIFGEEGYPTVPEPLAPDETGGYDPSILGLPGMPDAEFMAEATGGATGIPVHGPNGEPMLAVPQTERELGLYERFMAYDEEMRERLVMLEQRLSLAKTRLKGPLFSGQPDELDDDLLSLLDQV